MIAYLTQEPGWETVRAVLSDEAAISVVNVAEVLTKLAEAGSDPVATLADLQRKGVLGHEGSANPDFLVEVVPVTLEDALNAARLRAPTRGFGLSLGDRLCLATAARMGGTAVTADKRWSEIPGLQVTVRLIR